MLEKINLRQKFDQFADHWNPRVLGELNGQHVRAVKLLGKFDWHHHENEDEMFMVIRGVLKIEFRDKVVELRQGEFLIVPRMIDHRPVAETEAEVILFEPASTINTGNVVSERTKAKLQKI